MASIWSGWGVGVAVGRGAAVGVSVGRSAGNEAAVDVGTAAGVESAAGFPAPQALKINKTSETNQ